jgi:hypothetical protein
MKEKTEEAARQQSFSLKAIGVATDIDGDMLNRIFFCFFCHSIWTFESIVKQIQYILTSIHRCSTIAS